MTPGRRHRREPASALFVLKEGDTFLVADADGDITGEGDGLFHNDTRLLSTFRVLMDGQPPGLLSSAVSQDNAFFTANLTNQPLPPLGGKSMPEGVIHLERGASCGATAFTNASSLVNYSDLAARVPLQLLFAADFRDMFEVRGQARSKRGEYAAGQVGEHCVELPLSRTGCRMARRLDRVLGGARVAWHATGAIVRGRSLRGGSTGCSTSRSARRLDACPRAFAIVTPRRMRAAACARGAVGGARLQRIQPALPGMDRQVAKPTWPC